MRSRHDWVIWTIFTLGLGLTFAATFLPVINGVWLSFQSADSFISTPRWVGRGTTPRALPG